MLCRRFAVIVVVVAAAGVALLVGSGARLRADDDQGPAAKERVKRIAAEVEKIRGKPFKTEVGVEVQTADDFRKFVDAELTKELPEEKEESLSKTLKAFGLLPKDYDLRQGLSDLYVSQAGAYYNPETQKFYMLMVDMPGAEIDAMIAHELEHALQDQYFDLKKLTERAKASGDDDAEAALTFLVEGEAMLVMTKYQLKAQQGQDLDALGAMAEPIMRMQRNLDRETLLMLADMAGAMGKGGGDIGKAKEALKSMPGYLFWSLHSPYLKGQYTIYKAHAAKKDWAAVDAIFQDPPVSTEQALHPEKLAGEGRDEPTAVTLPELEEVLGPDWTLVRSNVLGEMGIQIIFEEHMPKAAAAAMGAERPSEPPAAGWDGDRYAVFEKKGTGDLLLVWKTTWDTESDAQEFAKAYAAVQKKRGVDGMVKTSGKDAVAIENAPAEAKAKLEGLFPGLEMEGPR